LDQQGRSRRNEAFLIGTLDVLGDRRVRDVAAITVVEGSAWAVIRREWKRAGRDHFAIDPAADVLVRRDEAQRRLVANRKIQHQTAAAVGAAAGRLRGVHRSGAFEGPELGRIGY
jgi:hypothetical protein